MGRSPSCSESSSPFLEPPHRHDPTSVSLLASLPSCVMQQLPSNVQDILQDIQESTCVAYASFRRLEDLMDERFDRLMPTLGSHGTTFSESSWFNYSNQFRAEHEYLVSEALPDWHQKAALAQRALQPYSQTPIQTRSTNSPTSIGGWWNTVHDCIVKWLESARQLALPEFDEIVEDYLSGRHDAAIYDTPDLSPAESLQPSGGRTGKAECAPSMLHIRHDEQKSLSQSTQDIEVVVKSVDLRKDSGISMFCL